MLNQAQKERFWKDGCITVNDAVTAKQLAAMRVDFEEWVEESRKHDRPFGKMLDGRPRFDVEPGHSGDRPALRRVASPTELSQNYLDVLLNSAMTDIPTIVISAFRRSNIA